MVGFLHPTTFMGKMPVDVGLTRKLKRHLHAMLPGSFWHWVFQSRLLSAVESQPSHTNLQPCSCKLCRLVPLKSATNTQLVVSLVMPSLAPAGV